MRWSNQQVLDHGVGADTALPGLRGLLRSVRTPEFAGTVFHEVEAKSALNRVPGSSPMPFGWTVNPYRGCAHACVYCLEPAARVLLPDGRTRPIADLQVGDAVVGTRGVGARRRYVRTTVLAHWSTVRPAYRVRLADGTGLVSSGEHRFLTDRGWRHVAPGWCMAGRRRRLRPGTRLLGPGRTDDPTAHGDSYRRGYLCGLVRGDTRASPGTDRAFPSVDIELEALGRAHHFLAAGVLPVAVPAGAAGAAGLTALDRSVPWPVAPDEDWCAGFVAGLTDVVGRRDAGGVVLRLADDELAGRASGALRRLGLGADVGSDRSGVREVRTTGAHLEFLRRIDPALARVRDLDEAPVAVAPGAQVVGITALGREQPMVDLTTGTGDFVADGVISHNCFARNSHTYLDLDAGADFDSQIVVKVNVARVLARELRSPRWRREPVAMGTNTDPYQRAEGRYRLMPGVLDALHGSGTPFSILTKGTVLGRDLPRIAEAARDLSVGLGVSLALLDRGLQSRLEPGTPSPAARLDLVRRIADAGLPCSVMVAPVLPLLTDSDDALDALFGRLAAAGASGASVLALHLRPGTREWFHAWLAREHPDLVEPYAELYRRGSYVDAGYRRALAARVAPLLRRHGLDSGVAALRPAGRSDNEPDDGAVAGTGSAPDGIRIRAAFAEHAATALGVGRGAGDPGEQLSLL